jgi:hypothetical protein
VALVLASPCFAHHGVAPHYDASKSVTLEGVVAKFDFINPHSFVYIDVIDAAGNTQTWSCEMASRSVLSRNGLTAERFAVGAKITVHGDAARHNATGCQVRTAQFADGTVLRDTTLYAPTYAAEADLPADRQSIVGVWTMKRFLAPRTFGVLTEAGKRASDAFDPIKDDPAIKCDPGSPVRFWINVNEPFEIKRETDRVVVDHRFMDAHRVIHSTRAARSAAGTSAIRQGASRAARSCHDGSLRRGAIEPRSGIMHTADLKLTERLEVNAEGELAITFTIDDPAFFKEPYQITDLFVRSRWDPEPYNCKPGYQQ